MRNGGQIFRLASEKSAGILTDFKLFSRSPDGIYAAKTCVQIKSEVPKNGGIAYEKQKNPVPAFGWNHLQLWTAPENSETFWVHPLLSVESPIRCAWKTACP